jgi:hypothetical protein
VIGAARKTAPSESRSLPVREMIADVERNRPHRAQRRQVLIDHDER